MKIRKLLKHLKSIVVEHYMPGDVVIATVRKGINARDLEPAFRHWSSMFPGVQLIILEEGLSLTKSLGKHPGFPSTVLTQEMIDDMCLKPPACEQCKTLYIETTKAGDEFRSYAKGCECLERRQAEANPEPVPAPAMVEVTQEEWDNMSVDERRAKHINIVRLPGGFRIPVTDLANLFK